MSSNRWISGRAVSSAHLTAWRFACSFSARPARRACETLRVEPKIAINTTVPAVASTRRCRRTERCPGPQSRHSRRSGPGDDRWLQQQGVGLDRPEAASRRSQMNSRCWLLGLSALALVLCGGALGDGFGLAAMSNDHEPWSAGAATASSRAAVSGDEAFAPPVRFMGSDLFWFELPSEDKPIRTSNDQRRTSNVELTGVEVSRSMLEVRCSTFDVRFGPSLITKGLRRRFVESLGFGDWDLWICFGFRISDSLGSSFHSH